MLGVLGELFGGLATARGYEAKRRQASQNAKLARMKGAAEQREAYEEARGIYETDKANKEIRAQQQRQARGKQTLAQSAARNMASGSGVSVEQGSSLEDEVRRAWDAQVDNMAQSSSIMHINAMQRAMDAKKSGDAQKAWAEVEATGYEYEAEQYGRLAKRTRGAAVGSAIVSGVAAGAGAYAGYKAGQERVSKLQEGIEAGRYNFMNPQQRTAMLEEARRDVKWSALQGMNSFGTMGWDFMASLNPYSSMFTVNPKGSWGAMADLLRMGYAWNRSSSGRSKNMLSDYETAVPVAEAYPKGWAYDWYDPGLFPPNDY